ncbi:MAG: cytochrome b/b6 domain-containing protein [Phycisphaerae bacterium]|jgi:cytochrome b
MDRVLVWDLPVRIFHWLLVAGFGAAAAIALFGDDDSPLFPYHAIIGLVLTLMVVLRVAWGFLGSRYARFVSFAYGPVAVAGYLKDALGGGGRRCIGHNPGSAYAIFAMLALLLGQGATGVLVAIGYEDFKEVHEVLAYTMLAVIGVHVLGVLLHSLRHRENIIRSMIDGTKQAEPGDAIPSSRPIAAIVMLFVLGAAAYGLLATYDAASRTTRLPLLSTPLQLGEVEHERSVSRQHEADDDHDDD